MSSDSRNPDPNKAKAFLLSALGAIGGGLLCGLLVSGVFDAVTGYGLPNPAGAIGAVLGAIAGGTFTSRYLRRKNSNEHRPIHVQVRYGDGEAIFEVEQDVELRESQGLKVRELAKAEKLAAENRNLIIQKWHEHINR